MVQPSAGLIAMLASAICIYYSSRINIKLAHRIIICRYQGRNQSLLMSLLNQAFLARLSHIIIIILFVTEVDPMIYALVSDKPSLPI